MDSWVATDDIGKVAAERLTAPVPNKGEMVELIGDVRSLRECHGLLASAGLAPRRIPIPVSLFRRMVGDELPAMWAWVAEESSVASPTPGLPDVPGWIATLDGR